MELKRKTTPASGLDIDFSPGLSSAYGGPASSGTDTVDWREMRNLMGENIRSDTHPCIAAEAKASCKCETRS